MEEWEARDGGKEAPASAKDEAFCLAQGPALEPFPQWRGFQSRLSAYENEELCALRWGRCRRRAPGSREPVKGPLTPSAHRGVSQGAAAIHKALGV